MDSLLLEVSFDEESIGFRGNEDGSENDACVVEPVVRGVFVFVNRDAGIDVSRSRLGGTCDEYRLEGLFIGGGIPSTVVDDEGEVRGCCRLNDFDERLFR